MWDLVGNPEDRFSHNEAHLSQLSCFLHMPTTKAQSDQHLCCSLTLDTIISLVSLSEISRLNIASFHNCADWFVSYLVINPKDRFLMQDLS